MMPLKSIATDKRGTRNTNSGTVDAHSGLSVAVQHGVSLVTLSLFQNNAIPFVAIHRTNTRFRRQA